MTIGTPCGIGENTFGAKLDSRTTAIDNRVEFQISVRRPIRLGSSYRWPKHRQIRGSRGDYKNRRESRKPDRPASPLESLRCESGRPETNSGRQWSRSTATEPAGVDLETAGLSGVEPASTLLELPLNGRDWTQLALLQPGVSAIRTHNSLNGSSSNRGSRGFGSAVSIGGGRPTVLVQREMEDWRSPLASIPLSWADRLGEYRATQVTTGELGGG
jgi:hypothetical protein